MNRNYFELPRYWNSLHARMLLFIFVVFTNNGICLSQTNFASRVVPSQVSLFVSCPNVRELKDKLASTLLGKFSDKVLQGGDYRTFLESLKILINGRVRPTGRTSAASAVRTG